MARLGRLHAGDGLHVQTGELGLDSLPLGILQQLTMRIIGDTQFPSVVSDVPTHLDDVLVVQFAEVQGGYLEAGGVVEVGEVEVGGHVAGGQVLQQRLLAQHLQFINLSSRKYF